MSRINPFFRFWGLLALVIAPLAQASDVIWLHELDITKAHQDYGKPLINQSIQQTPLSIGGQKFERGVGAHANMRLWLNLDNGSQRFQAKVGVDDAAGASGRIVFKVFGDGHLLWQSEVMKRGDKAAAVDLNVKHVKTLQLLALDAGNRGITDEHADWVDARFLYGIKPQTIDLPLEPQVILTPKPGPEPRINGPRVYGCRPGHPFIYRIPCQGERPVTFAADGLPASLKLDPASGIITGTVPDRGEYAVTFHATNSRGKSDRLFKIVSGDTLSLTPSMGWNDWYAHYDRITDTLVREAADQMIASGMADVGYQYVNIDDCWMNSPANTDATRVGPLRNDQGQILPNQHFPDMKALTDYIHAKGLKAGIYSSPGPLTCGHFSGSYQHEEQDARTFADWGFDFLKYDWCTYTGVAKLAKKSPTNALTAEQITENHEKYIYPYRLMGGFLKQQPRDMLFNLCQYGMNNVWEWGADVGGQSWRTAGDLGVELDRVMDVALANAKHRDWSKPGAWNDPDYIQIGRVGNAREMGESKPCPLTPNEQYSFMSLWCLMASPLFYSGEMNTLDAFTLNVLCNPEVIDVDQDPLGQSARVVMLNADTFLMIKDLEDGAKAVGLGNRGELETEVTAQWSDLGLKGRHEIRDLWRQKNLGSFKGKFKATVPRHGVVLVRVDAGAK